MLVSLSLVVVHNSHVVCVSFVPPKTDSILIVDADAVLSDAIPLQRFEVIAGTGQQIAKGGRRMQRSESQSCRRLDVCEPGNPLTAEWASGLGAAEGFEHPLSISYALRKA